VAPYPRIDSVVNDPGRPAFGRLVGAQVFAVAGDTLVTLAMAGSLFFSISPDAARGRVALYLLMTVAPFAVLGPLVGPALEASRGGHRMMLVTTAASRAAICLSMAGHLQSWWLFPEAFALLVLSKVHLVAKSALVPSMVPEDRHLVAANSRLAIAAAVGAMVAGSIGLAVVNLGFLGADWAVRLAGMAFAASAVASFRIPRGIHRPDGEMKPGEMPGDVPLADACESADRRYAVARALRIAAVGMISLRILAGFVTFALAFSFRDAGAPPWHFGLALGLSMAGALLGSAVAPRLRSYLSEDRILVSGLAAVAVVAAVETRLGGWAGAALLAGTLGVATTAGKLAFDSVVQRDAPEVARGRLFARFETRFQMGWVVGAGLAVTVPLDRGAAVGLAALGALVAFFVYLGGMASATVGAPAPHAEAGTRVP